MQRRATVGFVQQAVWRNGGLGSSQILFNFAAVALVPAAMETRHCCQAAASLVAMRAQPSSSADTKKNKVESLAQLDKLEKNDRDTSKDKQLAFAVFAALTPHRPPTPKNGFRHFSALPTHHPKQ